MLNSKKIVLLVIIATALAIGGFFYFKRSPVADSTPSSRMMIEISPKDLLEQIKGRRAEVTLVNVWASWCGPCIEELPLLVQLREEFKDRDFELVLYSADKPEDKKDALDFLVSQKIDFQNYAKGKASMDEIEALYPEWQGVLPISMIYDADGAIVQKWMGTVSYEEFKSLIEAAFVAAETK